MAFQLSFTLLDRDMHPLTDLTPLVLSGSLMYHNSSGRTRTATLDLKADDETEGEEMGEGREKEKEKRQEKEMSSPVSWGGRVPFKGRRGTSISLANAIQIKAENYPLALLVPTSSTIKQTSSGTILSLRLSDKYSLLDGTLGGILDTDVLVPAGSEIPTAIASLLAPYDPLPPVFQVNNKNIMSNNIKEEIPPRHAFRSPVTTYDIRIPAGKTVATVIEELADNMNSICSYDPSGRLVFRRSDEVLVGGSEDRREGLGKVRKDMSPLIRGEKGPSGKRGDSDLPAAAVKTPVNYIISTTTSIDYSGIINDVLVLGATVNNQTFLGRAENTDPSSETCISRIGRRTRLLSMPDYRSDDLCAAYARRVLRDHLSLSASTTLVLSPEAFPPPDLSEVSGYTLSFDPTVPLEVTYS